MISMPKFAHVTVHQELTGIKANQQKIPINENNDVVNVDEEYS